MFKHPTSYGTFSLALTLLLGLIAVTTVNGGTAEYQAEVLADNPFLFYRLGENSGTVADDLSGNMHDGTYTASPTLGVPGVGTSSDTAVTFDGATQYVAAPASANAFGSAMANSTFEFVFSSTSTVQSTLMGTFNTGTATGFEVNVNRNAPGGQVPGYLRLYLRDEGGSPNQMGVGFLPNQNAFDGDFHHLMFTYDSSGATDTDRFKGYLDGVPQELEFGHAGVPGTGGFANFGFAPSIAARSNRETIDQFFAGTLDEVALYTSTLTAADALARAQALGVEPDILSLVVNTVTGETILRNPTDNPIAFNYYIIESEGQALDSVGWNSLDEQGYDAGLAGDFNNSSTVDATFGSPYLAGLAVAVES